MTIGPLLGEYVVDFFPRWAEGKLTLRGSSPRPKARKTIEIVQDGLHRIVFETRWKRDERGWRVRDAEGRLVDLGWGEGAAAWIPLRDLDIEHVLALAEKVDEEKIGKEVWRKVRSFLKQLVDYAQLKKDFPRERANPVTLVAPPPQTGVNLVRRPYPPEIVERIRADFLALEELANKGIRRARTQEGRDAGRRTCSAGAGLRRRHRPTSSRPWRTAGSGQARSSPRAGGTTRLKTSEGTTCASASATSTA